MTYQLKVEERRRCGKASTQYIYVGFFHFAFKTHSYYHQCLKGSHQ